MGDISYAPLIEEMTWSFSRLTSFETCPHGWFLHYVRQYPDKERFYTSFGKYMHELLEGFYSGRLSREDAQRQFLLGFAAVHGERPSPEIVTRYINAGYAFLSVLEEPETAPLAVEKRLSFRIGDKPFIGVIDLLLRKPDGLWIVDHKSADIKPRSTRKRQTASDRDLDKRLRQLYLYAAAVESEYGELPSALCFNCFRTGTFIREPFDPPAYEAAKTWAAERVAEIEREEDFAPTPQYFYCRWLCPMSDHCDTDIAEFGGR